VNNRFSRYNDYVYSDLISTNIHYKNSEEEVPFIMRATIGAGIVKFHDGEIKYSSNERQLRNRVLTTNRVKEILDSAKVPLIVRIGALRYLIGKGFIAMLRNDGTIDVLFIAVARKNAVYIEDVKYYVSRSIYLPAHKKIQLVIKDLISLHRGDVLITNNIEKYVGSKIKLPVGKTIREEIQIKASLIGRCIEEYVKGAYPKIAIVMKPIDPIDLKQAKAAEIIEQILAESRIGEDESEEQDHDDYEDFDEDEDEGF